MDLQGKLLLLVFLLAISGRLVLAAQNPSGEMKEESVPAITFPQQLQNKLNKALNAKGPDYKPRTEHLLPDGSPRYTNRLILEDSPYLLQHAHNPVNWYPWGEEAFSAAKRDDKPIFLSIGYSTCHWCHVMEQESFDNPDIARLINRFFISIKVDRELRPDIDETYMNAVMMIAGHGGWPMSSFLTPDGDPFHGGAYYPPERFSELLHRLDELWQTRRDYVIEHARRVAAAVAQVSASRGKARQIDGNAIQHAVMDTLDIYDELQGGFGQAPKFPNEVMLLLLLDWAERTGDKNVLNAVINTLDAIARGGIHDQVGGGFHRYSTDNEWLVPHFEKMLYNQALLPRAFLKAWQMTGNVYFRRVAQQALDYVLHDMSSPEGGFYSATDADSEGEEGRFFVWTVDQVRKALPLQQAELAIELFGITRQGNFEGSNILSIAESIDEFSTRKKLSGDQLMAELDSIREQLRLVRERRIHPSRDEKIVTAWNGMMITTLAYVGDLLAEPRYGEAAIRTAEFLWAKNRKKTGELWRAHLHGSASTAASQEDYACFAEALLQLYDTSGDRLWLERARELVDTMVERFWDEQAGGFFMSDDEGLGSMGRIKDAGDGATPSGNSVALRVLVMLAQRTGEHDYQEHADKVLDAFSSSIDGHPRGYSYMLLGANALLNGEVGPVQYAGKGNVAISAKVAHAGRGELAVTVRLAVKEGWHINAHKPLQKELIATELGLDDDASSWNITGVDYPEPVRRRLGFQRDELSLYDGEVHIEARLKQATTDNRDAVTLLPLKLRLQTCSDRICLAPETIRLQIYHIDEKHEQ